MRTPTLLIVTVGLLLVSPPAHADARIAVLVGNNIGLPGQEPLRYAESDAGRMQKVLVELGGVDRRRAYLLKGQGRDRLQSTLAEVRGRAQELVENGEEVTLIFYFAGHGTADALHLGRTTIGRTELRRQLEALPCALRVIIIDTCRAQGGRTRGVRRGETVDVYVDDQSAATGTVVLTSSNEGEPAQESDLLGGAIFTHYFLSGLRGAADRDGDGRITLAEVYTHTYRRTVIRSGSGAPAVQHPAFSYDVEGSGEVILTQPTPSSAALMLPAGASARYLVYQLPAGTVLAEIAAERARPLRLAVPPGRLLIQRRLRTGYGLVEVELQSGRTHQVGADDFRAVPYEEIALRGGRFDLHPTSFGVRGVARFVSLPGGIVGLYGPELTVTHRFGRFELSGGFGVDLGSFTCLNHEVFEIDLRTEILLGAWFQLGPLLLHLRGGPRVVVLRQESEHVDAETLQRIGLEPSAVTWSTAVGGVLQFALGLPLGRGFNLMLTLQGSIVAMPLDDGEEGGTWRAVPGAGASLGVTFSP